MPTGGPRLYKPRGVGSNQYQVRPGRPKRQSTYMQQMPSHYLAAITDIDRPRHGRAQILYTWISTTPKRGRRLTASQRSALNQVLPEIAPMTMQLLEKGFVTPQAAVFAMNVYKGQRIQSRCLHLPSIPVTYLHRYAKSDKEIDRHYVASNPNCPSSILHRLANDSSIDVRSRVAQHPTPLEKDLIELAGDTARDVQLALLLNKNCPEHIRAALVLGLQDGDQYRLDMWRRNKELG